MYRQVRTCRLSLSVAYLEARLALLTSSPSEDRVILPKVPAEHSRNARAQTGVEAPGGATPQLGQRVPVKEQVNASRLRTRLLTLCQFVQLGETTIKK